MDRKERTIDMRTQIKQYAQELATLTDKAKFSDRLKEYFDFISKFHKYSWNNRILIYSQKPNASLIAGFNTWKKEHERHVKAGETGIWIFAPRWYKTKDEILKKNQETGKEELLEEEYEHIYFVPVPVFDVSQTEGKDVPTIDYGTNTNNHQDILIKLEGICTSENIELDYKPLTDGLNGYSENGKITLSSKNSIDDQAKTLMHELAHEFLHWDKDRGEYTKKQKETEAEATAFIVCRFLNVETKAFNYLALYKSDGELILNSLQRISTAVSKILKHFNGEIEKEKGEEILLTA